MYHARKGENINHNILQQKNTYRSDNNKKMYTIITNVKTSQLQPRTYTSYISCVKKKKYILYFFTWITLSNTATTTKIQDNTKNVIFFSLYLNNKINT